MPFYQTILAAKIALLQVFLLLAFSPAVYAKPMQTQKLTEEQKITKLIQYVEKSNAVFIRNGAEGSASDAAKHLKMKRDKAGKRVKTAKEFIDYIASKSSMTGEPYKVRFSNGTTMPLRDVLYYELKKLE